MSSFEVARGPTTIKCRSTVVFVRTRWGGRGWISPVRCQFWIGMMQAKNCTVVWWVGVQGMGK